VNEKQLREVATYYEDVWLAKLENGWSDGCVHYGLHIDGMSSKPKINTNRLIANTLVREMEVSDEVQRVLDLGCGVAGTMAFLRDHHPHFDVFGVCSSDKEKRVARTMHRGYDPVVWVFDYHKAWPAFTPRRLDAAYAIESLCQSWDRPAALANVWMSLVPGGVFLVLDAMLDGDVHHAGGLLKLYEDVRSGFHVPDLYEVPLMTELVNAGFEVEKELDFTPNVAESMFGSAGRAIYHDGTNAIPLRTQLHGLACVGMAGLLAHKKLRYTLTIARKPIDADTQAE
jgi:MPBQ/MSBQ methyltransferase